MLGAFVGIIKLKLDAGQTSCYQSAHAESKGWCSTSRVRAKLEVVLASEEPGGSALALEMAYLHHACVHLHLEAEIFLSAPLPFHALPRAKAPFPYVSPLRGESQLHPAQREVGDTFSLLVVVGLLLLFLCREDEVRSCSAPWQEQRSFRACGLSWRCSLAVCSMSCFGNNPWTKCPTAYLAKQVEVLSLHCSTFFVISEGCRSSTPEQ